MSRDRFTASAYHKLSINEKKELSTTAVRELSMACPRCDTHVMPADMLAHLELRCSGPREPGPGSKWLRHPEVLAMGVSRATLSRWANNGLVRFVGEKQDRKYLHRDLVKRVAILRGFRRR